MKVKFKKLHPDAITPSYSKAGDAGLDLTAVSINQNTQYIEYKTGIAFEIPENHVGLLFPRSSITKKGLMVKNSVGIIDSSFRGEVTVRFQDFGDPLSKETYYNIGDRVAQIVIIPIPTIELEEANKLSETDRGAGGYGSTGN